MRRSWKVAAAACAAGALLAVSAAPVGAEEYEDVTCMGPFGPQPRDFVVTASDPGPVDPGEEFTLEDLVVVFLGPAPAGTPAVATIAVDDVETTDIALGESDGNDTWGPLDVELTAPTEPGVHGIVPIEVVIQHGFADEVCSDWPADDFATVEVLAPPEPPEPGPQGPEGPPGPEGPEGPPGADGAAGAAGPAGEDGVDGEDGDDGLDGQDGLDGVGVAGPAGVVGATPTFTG